jgi:hypothetical protein
LQSRVSRLARLMSRPLLCKSRSSLRRWPGPPPRRCLTCQGRPSVRERPSHLRPNRRHNSCHRAGLTSVEARASRG